MKGGMDLKKSFREMVNPVRKEDIEKLKTITTQWSKFSYPGTNEKTIRFDRIVEDTRKSYENILLKLLNRGWAFIMDEYGNLINNPENKDEEIVEAWNIIFNNQFVPKMDNIVNNMKLNTDSDMIPELLKKRVPFPEIDDAKDITEIENEIRQKINDPTYEGRSVEIDTHWVEKINPVNDDDIYNIRGDYGSLQKLFEYLNIWDKNFILGKNPLNTTNYKNVYETKNMSVPLFTNLRSDFYRNMGYQIVLWPTLRNYDLDRMVGTSLAMESVLERFGMPKETDESNLLSNESKPILSSLKAISFFPNLVASTLKEKREYSGTDYMAEISSLIKTNESLQKPKPGSDYLPDLFIKSYSHLMPNFIFRRYKKGQTLPPYEGQVPHLIISDRSHFFEY